MNEKSKQAKPAAVRPHFWMWGDPITCHNAIREAWEAQHKVHQPMSPEAKKACAKARKAKVERKRLRRTGKRVVVQ